MIGNDIVDLEVARKNSKSANSRFLKKVFSEEEIEIIQNSDDPELVLWQLWSMKEAAYKAHQRNFGFPKILNPIKYQCRPEEEVVQIDKAVYHIATSITSEYLHSYTPSEDFHIKFLQNQENLETEIAQSISEANLLEPGQIIYYKNAKHLPVYRLQNSSEALPISLSHHGKFAAIIFPLINSQKQLNILKRR